MKKGLLLISTFFISISLFAQIDMPKFPDTKFIPRSPFLDSLNIKFFVQPIDTSFSFTDTFFKQRNKLHKKDSTTIKTISNIDINQYHLKNNKNMRRHGFAVGCTLLFSDIFPDSDIAYFSLTHKYLFNKKSNIKFLFLQSFYNSIYNYKELTRTSQMFSFEIGYEVRFYDGIDWLGNGYGDFINLFITSGITNLTVMSYGTFYQKEENKIIAKNNINSTLIKHRIGFGYGGDRLDFDMGFMFLYNFKEGVLNENMFGADINLYHYINRKK